ncbi:MAG TPA: phenylacetate--CoA ligase family protein [Sulfurospirillum arcachonense]|nr:phenylacetate--CoA ligase family protein [Sulfurospirillum arcachonense]HIP43985.1 phenylacetate--CoA ligase family protein [Sulfurospirillum arcachonense]
MTFSKNESFSKDELEAWQLSHLKETLIRVFHLVPFYKKRFEEMGVRPEDIKTLADISKLPFTTKKNLRDNYPFGMFSVEMDQIVRVHSSSGTTGKPTVVGYTEHDMDIWAEVMGRVFTMGGLTCKDILHNATGYGLFTGGLGFHSAAERMKIAVIPSSTGFTSRQLLLLKDFGATAITGTPSFALHLAEKAKAEGYDIKKDFSLRVGFFGAEPASDGLKDEIANIWGIDYHEVYGLSEIIGPGVASSCKHSHLLHFNEDHFYPEIIDPKTGEVLAEGERGELVVTTLTKQGLPIIRYKTGDITSITRVPCRCGRTLCRIESIVGRSDDMLVINGVNVFPSQIEHVLAKVDDITLNYQIIANKKGHLDKLDIDVELSENCMSDDIGELTNLQKHIQHELLNALYINVTVHLVAPKSLKRSEGKAVRVIDKRK